MNIRRRSARNLPSASSALREDGSAAVRLSRLAPDPAAFISGASRVVLTDRIEAVSACASASCAIELATLVAIRLDLGFVELACDGLELKLLVTTGSPMMLSGLRPGNNPPSRLLAVLVAEVARVAWLGVGLASPASSDEARNLAGVFPPKMGNHSCLLRLNSPATLDG